MHRQQTGTLYHYDVLGGGGGGGVKVGTKWNIYMGTCMLLSFHVKNLHEAQKHANFHAFSPFTPITS